LGLRDRAVLLLLWRLGLRAGEVAALGFDDFDWTGGTVRVGLSGKGRRETRLPLPQDVGDAVLAYLQRGRPAQADPHVFLNALRPWGPISRQSVASVVCRALHRVGLRMPSEGAHLLRHSLATHLLRQGQSLQAIAEILRHRSIETTAHYAKVDVTQLALIAQPWPEVTPC
jgi:site-specific recombinase XerD